MLGKLRLLVALAMVLAFAVAGPASHAFAQTGTCDTTGTVNGSATPVAGVQGDTIEFLATGFTPGEAVSFFFTLPSGQVVGTPNPIPNGVLPNGNVGPLPITITPGLAQIPGRWAITFVGSPSQHTAIIYFCIGFRQAAATATSQPAPTNTAVPPTATTAATNTVAASPTAAATGTAEASPTTAATVAATPQASETAVPAATSQATVTTQPVETATVAATAVPAATEVMGGTGGTGGVPGMPTTGQTDFTPYLVILAASLFSLLAGTMLRRRETTRK